MRLRLLLASGLAMASLGLLGCPGPKPGECKTTDDCKGQKDFESDVCVEGKCVECASDADCKAGFVCQANKCEPKPECTQNADCGAGKICKDQKCVAGCTQDSDCAGGKCMAGQCRPAGSCASDSDCPTGQSCQSGFCAAAPQAQCELKRAHFDFNESKLTGEAQGILSDDAQCIKQRKLTVELQGNADERGTEEYNLHLGERRAEAVKKYLEKLGVDANRMKTLSYGEERPINPGHDEAAWAENRRVDVVEK